MDILALPMYNREEFFDDHLKKKGILRPRCSQEQPGDSQEEPAASRSRQEAARSSQEQPGGSVE
jgi:hypothetical protein